MASMAGGRGGARDRIDAWLTSAGTRRAPAGAVAEPGRIAEVEAGFGWAAVGGSRSPGGLLAGEFAPPALGICAVGLSVAGQEELAPGDDESRFRPECIPVAGWDHEELRVPLRGVADAFGGRNAEIGRVLTAGRARIGGGGDVVGESASGAR
ncbi:hypothetical protein ACFV1L_17115 [Kitasatospora sp. NPDC059646]|uniref:hypothetical protein n=1 Tax=Kitasatospora sp. NPDC059646 TaxID=3346893 RepID=UPI0036C7F507